MTTIEQHLSLSFQPRTPLFRRSTPVSRHSGRQSRNLLRPSLSGLDSGPPDRRSRGNDGINIGYDG